MSICFFSRDPKPIPSKQFVSNDKYVLTNDIVKPSKDIPEIVKEMLLDKENDVEEEGDYDEKGENNVQYDIYQIKEKS